MSIYVTLPGSGIVLGPYDDSLTAMYQQDGWTVTTAPGGSVVAPGAPLAQQDFQNHLALGNLGIGQTNAESQQLSAQGGYLGSLLDPYLQAKSTAANWAQLADLFRGQTNSNLPAFSNALRGISPLNFAPVDPTQLRTIDWNATTDGMFPTDTSSSTDTSQQQQQQPAAAAPAAPASAQTPTTAPGTRTAPDGSWTSTMNADGSLSVVYHGQNGDTPTTIQKTDPAYNSYAPMATGAPVPAASPDLANSGGVALMSQPHAPTSDGSSGNSKIDWKNERESSGIRADDSTPAIDSQFKSGDPVGSSSNPGDFSTLGQSANDPANNPNAGTPDDNHHAARGTQMVVHHPTTITVGEKGYPEYVHIAPLALPGVGVSPQTAMQANAIDPRLHVQPHPAQGPIPLWAARLGRGHFATGGDNVYGAPLYGSGAASIAPSHQSFGDSQGGMISDTGQIKTESGSILPINETTPYIQPYQLNSGAVRRLTPLELQLQNSLLASMGEDPQSYWSRYQMSLPYRQQVPVQTRFLQGAA